MSATTRLSVPAEPAYAVVVRTVAMTLAAQATLDGDRVQDARLLVDEIFNTLLSAANSSTEITYHFQIEGARLSMQAQVPSSSGTPPATHSMQWRVLTALANHITAHHDDHVLSIEATLGNHA